MRLWIILIVAMFLGVPALAQDTPAVITLPHTGGDVVFGAAWSPDSRYFVRYIEAFFPDPPPKGILVEAATGEVLHAFEALSDAVWTPDGSRIIAVGVYPGVMALDATTFAETLLIEGYFENLDDVTHAVDKLAYYNYTERQTTVYSLLTGETLYTVPGKFVMWSADDSRFVTSSTENQTTHFKIYASATGEPIADFTTDRRFNTLSPDGALWLGHSDIEYEIRPIAAETPVTTFTTQLTNTRGCGVVEYFAVFSPDGTQVLLPYLNGKARIWDVLTGQPLVTLAIPSGEIRQAYWSSDGTRILAVAALNEYVAVFDTHTGAQLVEIIPDDIVIDRASAVWNAENTIIMIPSWDGITRLYDAASGVHLLNAEHHSILIACGTFLMPPALSPNGHYLVTWEDGSSNAVGLFIGGLAEVAPGDTLYTAPAVDSPMLPDLTDKVTAQVLAYQNGFWQVQLPDGTQGWSNEPLFSVREPRDPVFQIWRVPQP